MAEARTARVGRPPKPVDEAEVARLHREGWTVSRLQRHFSRPLRSDESVHHIDGDRANNDLGNLQLRSGAHGAGVGLVCRSCGSHDIEPEPLHG